MAPRAHRSALLVTVYALPSDAVTRDHDDLQAVVSTLPAAGLLGGPAIAYARGEPTRSTPRPPQRWGRSRAPTDAHTVSRLLIEGFIWDAAPAGGTISAVTTPPTESTLLINEALRSDGRSRSPGPCRPTDTGPESARLHRSDSGRCDESVAGSSHLVHGAENRYDGCAPSGCLLWRGIFLDEVPST